MKHFIITWYYLKHIKNVLIYLGILVWDFNIRYSITYMNNISGVFAIFFILRKLINNITTTDILHIPKYILKQNKNSIIHTKIILRKF